MKRFVLSVVVLGLFALPAWAQTNKALEVVPDDALGFILIKDLRQLYDKAQDLAGKTNAKSHFAHLDLLLNKDIKKGLNEKGSVVVVVMAGKDEKTFPFPILALPVGDPATLMQTLGVKEPVKDGISTGAIQLSSLPWLRLGRPEETREAKGLLGEKYPVLVAQRDGFVLLTTLASEDQLKHVLSAKKSIASMAEPAKTWLDEQDICGACTPAGMKAGIPFIGRIGPTGQPFIKDFEKNVKFVAFGARIEKEGDARLLTRVFCTEASPYGKRTGKTEPVQTTLFSSLSDERYLFAALARISPEANFENLIAGHHEKLPAAKAKELNDAGTRLLRRISDVALSVHADPKKEKETKSGHDPAAVMLLKVDDAVAFVEGATDLMKKHNEATNTVADTHTDLKFEPMRVADKQSVLITSMEKTKAAKSDKEPDTRPADVLIMTVLDPQTLLIGTLKKADQAESFVKAHSAKPAKSLEGNGELKKTFTLLSKQTQLAGFINLKNIFEGEGLKDCPPLGFALSMLPGSIEAQFVLPIETLQALVEADNARSKKEPEKK